MSTLVGCIAHHPDEPAALFLIYLRGGDPRRFVPGVTVEQVGAMLGEEGLVLRPLAPGEDYLLPGQVATVWRPD